MIVLALGLPSSASTWLYNVLRELLPLGETTAFEAQHLEAVRLASPGPFRTMLIKAHAVEYSFLNVLSAAGALGILSVRDPRDAVASIVERVLPDAADATQNIVRSYAAVVTASRALQSRLLIYEDRFFERADILFELAEFLRTPLTAARADEIFNHYSRNNVRALVEQLGTLSSVDRDPESGMMYDRATLFNHRHVGDARSGKWMEKIPKELHDDINDLFQDVAAGRLRPGARMCFSEALFSPTGTYVPQRLGPGLCYLDLCHLAAGRWQIRVHGTASGARNKGVYICHSGRIIGMGKSTAKGKIDFTIDYRNLAHDHAFSIHVQPFSTQPVDSFRPDRMRLEAVFMEA